MVARGKPAAFGAGADGSAIETDGVLVEKTPNVAPGQVQGVGKGAVEARSSGEVRDRQGLPGLIGHGERIAGRAGGGNSG